MRLLSAVTCLWGLATVTVANHKASANELVSNGSFETDVAPWTSSCQTALTADPHPGPGGGTTALRVSDCQRVGLTQSPSALLDAIRAAGNHARYRGKYWIKTRASASARLYLQLEEDGTWVRDQIVLAERVLLPSDSGTEEWQLVDGSWPISWSADPTDAKIWIEITAPEYSVIYQGDKPGAPSFSYTSMASAFSPIGTETP